MRSNLGDRTALDTFAAAHGFVVHGNQYRTLFPVGCNPWQVAEKAGAAEVEKNGYYTTHSVEDGRQLDHVVLLRCDHGGFALLGQNYPCCEEESCARCGTEPAPWGNGTRVRLFIACPDPVAHTAGCSYPH